MADGIVIFAHGSRIESANEAVRAVAAALARSVDARMAPAALALSGDTRVAPAALAHSAGARVVAAFLELGEPDLETAASRLAGLGVTRLVVVPYFLTLGLHMERDLPRIAERISLTHKNLEVIIAPPLDGHPALLQILQDRVREALS